MSDAFYWTLRTLSRPAFSTSGRPTILGCENVPRSGPVLLAANHVSWYDIPLLVEHCPRPMDFLAITELYQRPLLRWFYRNMNGIRYDRSNPDAHAVREVLGRLARGRLVAIFPEGKLCKYEDSLFTDHPLRPGMSRLAIAAQAPVLPVVVLDTDVYRQFLAWLPLRRARYGILFGPPLPPPNIVHRAGRAAAIQQFETEYRTRMRELREELLRAMSS
ncbi:MAG: lysophospholipid acyltransferase family protein [Lentisphaerota bacterium]